MDYTLDQSIEVRWVNNKVGYGVFAKHKLYDGHLLGEYNGVLGNSFD
jgi:SET domain-containing protein